MLTPLLTPLQTFSIGLYQMDRCCAWRFHINHIRIKIKKKKKKADFMNDSGEQNGGTGRVQSQNKQKEQKGA